MKSLFLGNAFFAVDDGEGFLLLSCGFRFVPGFFFKLFNEGEIN
jgi:hypothetical protein